jgi:hypothetical protein
MLTKTLPFSALVAQGRWKVEFFMSDHTGAKSTAYPLIPLKDILADRHEFLDPQQYPDYLFNYLGLEHIHPLTGDLADEYQPRRGRAVLSRCKVFRCGDVLYGRLRPSLNKVFIADGAVIEGICSGEFYVLIPDSRKILPHFARSLLASRYVQEVVKSMTSGSALPRLALEDLLEIEIPLPSVDVQQKYEELLIAQNAKRQQVMAELRDGPAANLEAIVSALEEGTPPTFSRSPPPRCAGFETIVLPESVVVSRQGRGRIKGKQDVSLF